MREEPLFVQMKMWRGWTVDILGTIPEEIIDEIPNGFNNHILWNVGHILAGWDATMFPAVCQERQLSSAYHQMFQRGSKPEEWTGEPPSIKELVQLLKEQPARIEQACKGHLGDQFESSFLPTLGEMFLFQMNHENLHVGTIKAMKQILLNR